MKNSGSAPPPPPPTLLVRRKHILKVTRHIYMSRCYAGRRDAGLGPYRVRTRIPSTRRLGQWVSLRKILRCSRVRLRLSQPHCLSLFLAMSGRVSLSFFPRGHEPPPTLGDRLNPHLSLPSLSNPPLCPTPGCRSVRSQSTLSPSHPVLSELNPQRFQT